MTIRNDATRQRVPVRDPRPLRGVVARQGQVLLDTDINEAERTLLDRTESADAAMLGPRDRLLYPAGSDAFRVSASSDGEHLGVGTGYLGGWQLVNTTDVTLASQPNPWSGSGVSGPSAVVLKALIRHVDPVEEQALADVALGDAQASGRAIDDWQAFLLPVPAQTDCASVVQLDDWQRLIAASTGTLAFHLNTPTASTDPCTLTPTGGHSRFENLLYRIEVHGGKPIGGVAGSDGPRFSVGGLKLKFSRRNASLMVRVTHVAENRLTVAPAALDPRHWFEPGSYAEIVHSSDDIDPAAASAGERLFKVALASDEQVTLSASAAQVANSGVKADGEWYLRLWDAWPGGSGFAEVAVAGGPLDLGDGIAITLAGGGEATYRRGDYWTAAVRADGTIAWPGIASGAPEQQPPHGPEIRYAPLAILEDDTVTDCRVPFATLSDRTLLYRGGDGQETYAPVTTAATPIVLNGKLRVAVMRGATPVKGAWVRWRTPDGAKASWIDTRDTSVGAIDIQTDDDGLVAVEWAIDARHQDVDHFVEAVLLDGDVPAATPPVVFGARFATAARTSFTPGDCPTLRKSESVQQALDALCAALGEPDPATLRLRRIALLGQRKQTVELIEGRLVLNALEVDANALADGIRFEFDVSGRTAPVRDVIARGDDPPDRDPLPGRLDRGGLQLGVRPYDPVAEIAVDLPYPLTVQEGYDWLRRIDGAGSDSRMKQWGCFGFRTVRLDGAIDAQGDAITWTPSEYARIFLTTAARHRFGSGEREGVWQNRLLERVLCRIRLRAALIFADDRKSGERIWLNAEHLGTRDKVTARELLAATRDPQKAADLDMFIYLAVPEPGIIFFYPKDDVRPFRSNLGTVDDGMRAAMEQWTAQPYGVQLTAHADDRADAAINLELSQKRAEMIKDALVSNGIPADAIAVQAMGDGALPHPPANPDAADSTNRRVVVLPGSGYKP